MQEFISAAAGWPAIIGLASFADSSLPSDREALPPELHAYIAEELYGSIAPSVREELAQLSLLPSISSSTAANLLGTTSPSVVAEGTRVGFLTDDRSGLLTVHPLLRSFLRRKMLELPPDRCEGLVENVVRLLLGEKQWNEAFEVARQFEVPHLFDQVIESSLYDLLDCGHLATLSTFVEVGRIRGAEAAVLDLAEAELVFREGFHERARRLAERAGAQLVGRLELASKAFCRAGHSAYFTDAIDDAVANFQRARDLAPDLEDERRAVWGLFLSALEQEDDSAAVLLGDFEAISGSSANDMARIQNGRLHFAMRLGTLRHGLSGADAVASIASEAKDPVVRASFWHIYAAALRAAAEYGSAVEATDSALREISRFDLDFGRAHVYLTRAGALAGMAAYEEALDLLDDVARSASRNGDTYLQMNERTTRCKLLLLTGEMTDAVRVTDVTWAQVGSRGQYAEFLASRALALATLPQSRHGAIEVLEQAERTSGENEATALCTCVRALLSIDREHEIAALIPRSRTAIAKGILDPFVFALRLDRRLPRLIAQMPDLRSALHEVLRRVDGTSPENDTRRSLAYEPLQATQLTRREQEVLVFLADGSTNKEIAARLFLTESTVKVHVRHVLQKLGVRTRTEAAIQVLKTRQHEAGAASEPLNLDPDSR